MPEPRASDVLLVDDDDSLRRVLEFQLREDGHDVTAVANAEEALERFAAHRFDVVLADILMPGMDGIELLDRILAQAPETVVLMLTAHGSVETAVRAMQLGALDFLLKPFSGERLRVAVRKALEVRRLRVENRALREVVQASYGFANIVGSSRALQELLADVARAATSDATVLLTGESGTGKELVAEALHFASPRRDAPFVVVNCGAIAEGLVESELFGHRKGAFSGAVSDRDGKLYRAHGGTVFLDEIAEIPLPVQPRLLRVLQEGELDVVGSDRPVRVDVRVVAATHRDLEREVREGRFREDLFYRLHVVPLRVPPLRERREDVPLLVEHFLREAARRHGRSVPRVDAEVFRAFEAYPWPGNVRELENLIERLVVLGRDDAVRLEDLPEPLRSGEGQVAGVRLDLPPDGIQLEEVEKALIVEALRRCGGNQSAAARYLGITRQTLIYRMQKFDLR